MSEFWLVFWWTGPIGVGIFLVCLATMIYLLAKADAVSKKTKATQSSAGHAPQHEAIP